MGIRGKPPEGGSRVATWTHDKVAGGETRSGWLAGDVHCIPCHPSTASRPCLELLTGRKNVCPGCNAHKPVATLGFVPLFRYDGRPMVVVVREHQFELVGAIEFGCAVYWSRNKGAGETISVVANPDGKKWRSTLPERNRPADLCPWLCVLWRMPELEADLRRCLEVQCQPVVTQEIPEPLWVRGVQEAAAQAEAGKSWEEFREGVLQKAAKLPPGSNGRKAHK